MDIGSDNCVQWGGGWEEGGRGLMMNANRLLMSFIEERIYDSQI